MRRRPFVFPMNIFLLTALGFALGYAALQRAGAEWNDWNPCLLVVGVVGLLHSLVRRRAPVPPLDRTAGISAGFILLLAAFQIAPLPLALVRLLSPARAALFQSAYPFTGGPAGAVTLSIVPYETVQYLLTLGGYLLLILVVRDLALRLEDRPWSVVWPLLIVAGLEAVLGLFQASEGSIDGVATGTYANRDHYAALLEMVLPFAGMYPVAILQRDRQRHEAPAGPALKACLLLALATVMLTAIVLSLSRMAFLASLAGLFVAAAATLIFRAPGDYAAGTRWRRKWAPLGILSAMVVLGFIYLPTDSLIRRFSELAKSEEIAADTRARIWRDTTTLIQDYPLFGCGMGGYGSCFLLYKTVAPMNTVDYVHNDYLQVLAELGILGFLAGLVFVGRVLQQTRRGILHAATSEDRYLAIACLSSITAMLLHSLVDFNMYVPANGMVFAWVMGTTGIHLRRRRNSRRCQAAARSHEPERCAVAAIGKKMV
jgi:O-antigen ligase